MKISKILRASSIGIHQNYAPQQAGHPSSLATHFDDEIKKVIPKEKLDDRSTPAFRWMER